MDFLNFNSVVTDVVAMLPGIEHLPGLSAHAMLFASKTLSDNKVNSSSVFKEDVDIVPTIIDDKLSYILLYTVGRRQSNAFRHSLAH